MSKKLFERMSKYNSGKGLGERKSVHLTYHKQSTKRVVKRKVDPLGVRGDLLLAYDHKRKNIRSFKLERVRSMEKVAKRPYVNGSREKVMELLEAMRKKSTSKSGAKHRQPFDLDTVEKRVHRQMQKKGSDEMTNFWAGFEKQATNSVELAGLGLLAAPAVSHLAGKEWKEKNKNIAEVGGLGILAAPYAKNTFDVTRAAMKSGEGLGKSIWKGLSHHA